MIVRLKDIFFVLLLLASSSEGFTAWFDSLLCSDLVDWWRSVDCLVLFVLVISFTLCLEYFLSSLEALAELNKLREDLGGRVKPLDDGFFATP